MSRVISTDVQTSYIQWGPVIAGAAIALGVTAILVPFGEAIGLSVTSKLNEDNAKGMIFGIGLWVLWTQLISSIIGGYFAGRTLNARVGENNSESEFRDGTHGLLSWCLASFATALGVGFLSLVTAIAPEQAQNNVQISDELARQSGVIFAFILAGSSLVSAVAAWAMASLAGDHRDKQIDFSSFYTFRKKRKR